MPDIVLKVENIWKQYRLGLVGANTLKDDLSKLWAKIRGKEDPTLQIGQTNDRQNITGEYVWALQDINFEVKRGEVVGIIGKNGAGKSTLLKILSKVTSPTKGEIKAKGRIASLLEVGTGFHPDLTGRENVFLNGAILGMHKYEIKSKFDEIVEFSGIGKYIDTPVKRYSSGMYVRLAFAVAAHLDPEILIIDEVLAVGDAEFQKKCLGKMKDVAREGRTVLFVSHNMAAVSTLCTRGVFLSNGTVSFEGKVEEAIKKYIFSSSATHSSMVDFTNRAVERYGNQEYACWQGITLMNEKDERTSIFRMGDKMRIQLQVDILKGSDDFEIGVGIGNLYDVYLHYLISTWEGFTSIQKIGTNILTIEIPSILLFPGDYQLIIWIALKGAYYDDAIHEAIQFKVEEGKLNDNETYFERFSKNTQVYTPSHWTLTD